MNKNKLLTRIFILMISQVVSVTATAASIDDTFIDTSSVKISKKNKNLLEFKQGLNFGPDSEDKELIGKSAVNINFINCTERYIITDSSATVYSKFNGEGVLLHTAFIPSRRIDLSKTSSVSMIAAAMCIKFNRPFGNNPDALKEQLQQWHQLGEELKAKSQ